MDYDVTEAQYVGAHVIWLQFKDGTSGAVDLSGELEGPVFEPLRDPAFFRQFRIDADFETLTWPNGADFAPEFLHDSVRVAA